jgi:hypothetical protein
LGMRDARKADVRAARAAVSPSRVNANLARPSLSLPIRRVPPSSETCPPSSPRTPASPPRSPSRPRRARRPPRPLSRRSGARAPCASRCTRRTEASRPRERDELARLGIGRAFDDASEFELARSSSIESPKGTRSPGAPADDRGTDLRGVRAEDVYRPDLIAAVRRWKARDHRADKYVPIFDSIKMSAFMFASVRHGRSAS